MSKILNNLSATMQARSQKYTALVQQQRAEQRESVAAQEPEHRITLDKQTFLFILCCGMLVGLFALTVSYKALVNIQAKNVTVSELREMVSRQDRQIKTLSSDIQKLGSDHSQHLNEIKKDVAAIDQVVNNSDRQLTRLGIDSNVIHVIVDTLKEDNKALKKQYSDLSEEVRAIKNLQAQKIKMQSLQAETIQ